MDPSAPALTCSGLTRTYSRGLRRTKLTAVDHVDLEVPSGAAFALVGPNGAGKTTLMLMALGLMRPTAGTALIGGRVATQPGARRGVGFVPEKFQLPRHLTAREFLRLHASLAGLDGAAARQRIEEVARTVQLWNRIDERVGGYSKGMQQRIAIAQALLGRPSLLVLDEPTSALDPLQRRALRDLLRVVHADGCTVLLNSHNLAEVEDICDHVAILQDGRIARRGVLAELVGGASRVRVHVRGWNAGLAATLATRVTLPTGDASDTGHAGAAERELSLAVDDPATIPWIARAVVESGAELLELAPMRGALEDLFVRTVTDADPEVEA